MKRFHVHLNVENLAESIDFYTRLLGQAPSKRQADYAKWMLDAPRINFAISSKGQRKCLNHLGFQVDSDEALQAMKLGAQAQGITQFADQTAVTCCYAQSNKHWITDPQGIAWEHFYTMQDAIQYDEELPSSCAPTASSSTGSSCCASLTQGSCCA